MSGERRDFDADDEETRADERAEGAAIERRAIAGRIADADDDAGATRTPANERRAIIVCWMKKRRGERQEEEGAWSVFFRFGIVLAAFFFFVFALSTFDGLSLILARLLSLSRSLYSLFLSTSVRLFTSFFCSAGLDGGRRRPPRQDRRASGKEEEHELA